MNRVGKSFLVGGLVTAALAFSPVLQAQLVVTEAWVRATVPAQQASGAFMRLQATEPVRVTGARSAAAELVEIHESTRVNNVMRMRHLPNGITLKSGQLVSLKPGGLHIMLMKLHGQLEPGQSVRLDLQIELPGGRRGTVPVDARVVPLGTDGSKSMHEHHHGKHKGQTK